MAAWESWHVPWELDVTSRCSVRNEGAEGTQGYQGRSCKVLLDRSQQPCPEEEAEAGGKEGPGRCLLRAERIDNWTSL